MEHEIDRFLRETEGTQNPTIALARQYLMQLQAESATWQRQCAFNLEYRRTEVARLRALIERIENEAHDGGILPETMRQVHLIATEEPPRG